MGRSAISRTSTPRGSNGGSIPSASSTRTGACRSARLESPQSVNYRASTADGGPRGLLGLANREHADAIVVGRRWRSGLAELVLGSFSHHLVHHSSRPVIVVPQDDD